MPHRLLGSMLLAGACARGIVSPPAVPHEGRYLALGDSYTIGEHVDSASRWPVQLATSLRARGVAVAAPEVVARTGWTTSDLAAALDRDTPFGPYALVSLLIGVNDQAGGSPAASYEVAFRALLSRAIGFAGGDVHRVIVLSAPDWSVTPAARAMDPAAIRAEIDAYNAVARRACLERGVHFVDITAESREAAADRTLLADDGLHPSARMYAAWVALALPTANAAINGR